MLLPLLLLSLSPTILCDSLRNQHLTVSVTTESMPHLFLKDGHENLIGNDKYDGLLTDLLTELSMSLGFTYTIKPVSDGRYGTVATNGNWNGMIGEVLSGEADIAVADMTITAARESVVDFVPYMSLGLGILYNKRGQGNFHSLEELSMMDSVKVGAFYGGSTMNYFKSSRMAVNQRIWAKMEKEDSMTRSNLEGVEKVLEEQGGFAHIMETTSLDYVVARNCDLIKVGETFSPRTYGLAIPQGSPYREELTVAVLRLQEYGRMEQFLNSWIQPRHGSCDTQQSSMMDWMMRMFE